MPEVFSYSKAAGHITSEATSPQPISIMDWQRFLKDEGYYHGEIDGILGPLLQKAWDSWRVDEYVITLYEEK